MHTLGDVWPECSSLKDSVRKRAKDGQIDARTPFELVDSESTKDETPLLDHTYYTLSRDRPRLLLCMRMERAEVSCSELRFQSKS